MVKVDIEFVKSVAVEAGDRAVKMISDIRPEFKADDSFVTHIDKETEQFVRARLAERYPDFAFQGEEFGRFGQDGVPLWAVDPIDGTTNLVFGIPIWCVSIGLIDDGHAVARHGDVHAFEVAEVANGDVRGTRAPLRPMRRVGHGHLGRRRRVHATRQ